MHPFYRTQPYGPASHAARLALAIAMLAVLAGESRATVVSELDLANDHAFPKPPIVRQQMRFWEKIFGKYPSTTVIVHDSSDTDRIIDVIDYKMFASRSRHSGPAPRKEREMVTAKYLTRYTMAAERFIHEGERATRYGAIEKRLYEVYKNDPVALAKLYAGDIKIRAQTGLADDFVHSAATARAYLPYMESVFSQYGLPKRLTRLAFVESMFNLKARSKVGASGIWQFMPQTARNYIYVTSLVDERNSPYKATRAAAQFLQGNYRSLGTWPLAVTAYNHGGLGMSRAVKQVGTSDLGKIIKRYDSSSFGFASKNFYAEFLAAAATYDRLLREGKIDKGDILPETESIVLQHPLSIDQIVSYTPLTKNLLAENNPCLLPTTLSQNSSLPLPRFYELKVPLAIARATKVALNNLKNKIYARR